MSRQRESGNRGSGASGMRSRSRAEVTLLGAGHKPELPRQLSMLHNRREEMRKRNSKDLLTRATGRFYTHEFIGRRLADVVVRTAQLEGRRSVSVIDPFCGDGRLIGWFLEAVSKRDGARPRMWSVELWDCDAAALDTARKRVLETAAQLGVEVEVETVLGDTFAHAPSRFGEFVVCLTNPPWELLKPDRRELDQLDEDVAREYVAQLRQQSSRLVEYYPLSAPRRRYAGWGMNLARAGTEVALRLTANDGVCGVVSPASLLADQMSESLRRWVFEEYVVHDIAYYVAEAKLFDEVDQPSVTLVVSPGVTSHSPTMLVVHDRALRGKEVRFSEQEWHSLRSDGYVFPLQFGPELLGLRSKWDNLPSFADLEGESQDDLWAGRELDETGHRRFLGDKGDYLFVKGRMVSRFRMCEAPSQYVNRDGPRIPSSADHYRLAWRDISRPNQRRRIQAAIVPPGMVTGNSLHVAYFRDDDLERLKALLAVMNSFVFEAQVRMRLATAHVSLGVVRKARVPPLNDRGLTAELAQLVARCEKGDEEALTTVEVRVAQLYGLSHEDFALLLSAFEKVEEEEKRALLTSPAWRCPSVGSQQLAR